MQTRIADGPKPFPRPIEPSELLQIGWRIHERASIGNGQRHHCRWDDNADAFGDRPRLARKPERGAVEFLSHHRASTLPNEIPMAVGTRGVKGTCFRREEPDSLVRLLEGCGIDDTAMFWSSAARPVQE